MKSIYVLTLILIYQPKKFQKSHINLLGALKLHAINFEKSLT